MTEAGVPARSWRGSTVRARVLAAVLALSALGLVVAGVTAYVLERERLDGLIDNELARSVEEFRVLADQGVDPSTGSGFRTTEDLLRVALQRVVTARNEGALVLVDGRIPFTAPSTVRLRLEDDPELVAAVADHARDPMVRIRSLATAERDYRYVAVPVRFEGDPARGLLVYAFDHGTEHASLTATYRTYSLVAVGALLLTGVVGWLTVGRLLAPVRELRRTAQQVTDSDLSARIAVTGDDDLADLARTVNAMLDRLEAAFASQRRLLDDVGHELRTPLTIVRGHLELADPDDPRDVEAVRALALDEVDRMHRLVDDLVVLAKADRPDFVRTAPTEVAQLVDEVLDKARTLGSHEWRIGERAEVEADLDAQRITQALLQLAANAVKFAPAGSTVTLASKVVDDDVLRLTVQDDGPGIAPEDAERVFERFQRTGGGRGVEGSGLGLPIVRAIARAHGGTAYVTQDDAPGATVVIDVPLRRAVPPEPTVTARGEADALPEPSKEDV